MKCLLLPLLAALAFPASVSAEWDICNYNIWLKNSEDETLIHNFCLSKARKKFNLIQGVINIIILMKVSYC